MFVCFITVIFGLILIKYCFRLVKHGQGPSETLLGFIGFVIGILMVLGSSYILAYNLDVVLNTRITPKN